MIESTKLSSSLAEPIADFVSEKRACGYRYLAESQGLEALDRHLVARGHMSFDLPKVLVDEWTARRPHETPRNQEHRVRLVHQFARYLLRRGVPAHLPDLRGCSRGRASSTPHIFSREEIARLLAAADALPVSTLTPSRHLVIPEVFRVLSCCGLRVGEALHLRLADTDLERGILTIRDGKFQKDRLVPLPASLRLRLTRYAVRLGLRGDGSAFFPGPDGDMYSHTGIYKIFRRLLRESGIPHGGRGRGPRIHDLRHSFAVHRLEAWYRAGADLGAKLLLLSTYMGHRSIEATQIYLRLTPHLFPDVASRMEEHTGHVIPRRATP